MELGANWVKLNIYVYLLLLMSFIIQIYGKGQNPIYKLAIDHDLKTVANDKTNLAFFDEQGMLMDQNQGTSVYDEFESIKLRLVAYAGNFFFIFLM